MYCYLRDLQIYARVFTTYYKAGSEKITRILAIGEKSNALFFYYDSYILVSSTCFEAVCFRILDFKGARATKSFLGVGRIVRKIRKVNRCFLNGLGRISDEDAKGFANGEGSRNGVIFTSSR